MKNLLLFALLSSVSAFGQAYSDSVTQNSPGNYGRPVPFASVQVCNIADTATPCTQKVNTFTDDGLGVACTQSAGSGVLTGAPVSGANCNNPGIADANGNFTIYVVPGQYRICTYANNWLCQNVSIGGSGGGIPFACASAVNGSIVGMTSTTTSSCDPNGITDFIGHWTSQSYRATGSFNGTVELTGGLSDPTNAPDTNSVALLAPLTVPTPYYLRPPSSPGTVGQLIKLQTQATGSNGTVDALDWLNAVTTINGTACSLGASCSITVGGTVEFQTNSVDNANCTAGACPLQNLVAGSNITLTNTSGGNVSIAASGAAAPQALNPTAPTLTTNGSAGSTSYSYKVVGCEDGSTCAYHSAATSASTIATGNATLTSSNSINVKTFADTLYGYRCYNVYRTATAGTPNTTGLIASCVWKSFIDTGVAGDSSTPPSTNTTVLDANGLTNPLPGCNKIPGSPYGIDGVPCAPTALDDEFAWGNGSWVPGDANNPFWTQVNWGTTSTALTNGELQFIPQVSGSALPAWRMLVESTPSRPWTFVTVANVPWLNGTTATGHAGMCVYDGTKLLDWAFKSDGSLDVTEYDTVVHGISQVYNQPQQTLSTWLYFKIQDDNTNLNFLFSVDGISYTKAFSQARTSFLANTNFIGICADVENTTPGNFADFDYFRRTQ